MRTLRLTIIFLACASAIAAEAQTGILRKIDRLLDKRDMRADAKTDTTYVGRPEGRWTVKLRMNVSGTNILTRGLIGGGPFTTRLYADAKTTVGASVSYRGLSLGFSLNPAKLAGWNKDYELNFTSYGNRVGGDIVLTSAKTFRGRSEYGGAEHEIARGSVGMETVQANAYYAFNRRRFSFPAAFSQSKVQRRSCGTWLLGLSAFAGRIDTEPEEVLGVAGARLSMVNVAVGGGYAYNFVTRRKWLIHVSAVPTLVVYARNRLTVGDVRQRAPLKFPSFISVGRLAVVRHFGNKFVSLSAVVNLWHQGDRKQMMIESTKWRARMSYGFRF